MADEKKEETKTSEKKYDGGPIPKVTKAAQERLERAEKEAESK
jgi:hypothetical protein